MNFRKSHEIWDLQTPFFMGKWMFENSTGWFSPPHPNRVNSSLYLNCYWICTMFLSVWRTVFTEIQRTSIIGLIINDGFQFFLYLKNPVSISEIQSMVNLIGQFKRPPVNKSSDGFLFKNSFYCSEYNNNSFSDPFSDDNFDVYR